MAGLDTTLAHYMPRMTKAQAQAALTFVLTTQAPEMSFEDAAQQISEVTDDETLEQVIARLAGTLAQ